MELKTRQDLVKMQFFFLIGMLLRTILVKGITLSLICLFEMQTNSRFINILFELSQSFFQNQTKTFDVFFLANWPII